MAAMPPTPPASSAQVWRMVAGAMVVRTRRCLPRSTTGGPKVCPLSAACWATTECGRSSPTSSLCLFPRISLPNHGKVLDAHPDRKSSDAPQSGVKCLQVRNLFGLSALASALTRRSLDATASHPREADDPALSRKVSYLHSLSFFE